MPLKKLNHAKFLSEKKYAKSISKNLKQKGKWVFTLNLSPSLTEFCGAETPSSYSMNFSGHI